MRGPRRVGKTTVMQKALEYLQLDPCNVDNFYSSVLDNVRFKYEGINKVSLVKNSLEEIQRKGGKKPTFAVEINEKCDAHQLMLCLLK